MKNPFKKVKEFFSEEPEKEEDKLIEQKGTGIFCQNCQEEIHNKPKFFKMNGQRIVICKSCFRQAKKQMGA